MNTVVALGNVNIAELLSGGIFPACAVVRAGRVSAVTGAQCFIAAGSGARLPDKLSALAVAVDFDSGVTAAGLCGNSIITCGLGGKNTVSVTSKTTEQITLSLNRALRTLSGLCEPLELPVPLYGGFSDFDYMAAFAASVVFGQIE